MAEKYVVFVLGAGASLPYGFPSGADLIRSIVKKTDNFTQFMASLGYEREKIDQFQTDLRKSQLVSVDNFLRIRKAFAKLGKAAIAYHMIPRESFDILYEMTKDDEKWFRYLWETIRASKQEQFMNSPIRFITFNYDRSLDLLVFNALETICGTLTPECKEFLCDEFITHVHGMLGELREITGKGRKYENTQAPGSVNDAAAAIKIAHEAIDSDSGIIRARRIIADAETVIFLGFGFHQENIANLHLHACPVTTLYGTGFGLTPPEVLRVQAIVKGYSRNASLELGPKDMGVLEYLRNHHYWQRWPS